jgi:hypothetical protein
MLSLQTKFIGISGASDLSNMEAAGAFKMAMSKKWDARLYTAHRRQWDAAQKEKAKLEAAIQAKGART